MKSWIFLFLVLTTLQVAWAQLPGGSPCTMDSDCLSATCGANGICCGGNWINCFGDCVNTQNDENNCGSCGFVCSMGTICLAGTCVVATPTGNIPFSPSLLHVAQK